MPSYQCRKSLCGDKMILRPSYLHKRISYTGKVTSLNWIRAQGTVSTWRYHVTSIGIPMLKIRRSHDSLIFNTGISIPGKDGLYIGTGPRLHPKNYAHGMQYVLLCSALLPILSTYPIVTYLAWGIHMIAPVKQLWVKKTPLKSWGQRY